MMTKQSYLCFPRIVFILCSNYSNISYVFESSHWSGSLLLISLGWFWIIALQKSPLQDVQDVQSWETAWHVRNMKRKGWKLNGFIFSVYSCSITYAYSLGVLTKRMLSLCACRCISAATKGLGASTRSRGSSMSVAHTALLMRWLWFICR